MVCTNWPLLPRGNTNKTQNSQDPKDEVCILKHCDLNIKTALAARGQTGKTMHLDIAEAALPPPRVFHPSNQPPLRKCANMMMCREEEFQEKSIMAHYNEWRSSSCPVLETIPSPHNQAVTFVPLTACCKATCSAAAKTFSFFKGKASV